MALRKLTIDDMREIDRRLSDVEAMLSNTKLDDESYLLNHIRNYIRIKRRYAIEEVDTDDRRKE